MTPYIDMHCDTLMKAWMKGKKDLFQLKNTMTDVQRLQAGGCRAQFFAIFLLPVTLKKKLGPFFPKDETYIAKLCGIYQNTLQRHPGQIGPALSCAQLEQNAAAGRLSGVLTMEDGRAVAGRLENLDRFYQMGVRVLGLTWNHANCFGAPNAADEQTMAQGLTAFGKESIAYMNQLGMGIDVSHLSDGGFWDVARLSQKPFFATHSNCRALNPHPRSLTDEMIRALAEKGGVMGLNFGPQFLTADTKCKDSRIDAMLAQLRHMVKVGGIGCAAIGTDFDGVSGNMQIASASEMPLLFEAMEQAGFTADEIETIACKNVQRVLREVL